MAKAKVRLNSGRAQYHVVVPGDFEDDRHYDFDIIGSFHFRGDALKFARSLSGKEGGNFYVFRQSADPRGATTVQALYAHGVSQSYKKKDFYLGR